MCRGQEGKGVMVSRGGVMQREVCREVQRKETGQCAEAWGIGWEETRRERQAGPEEGGPWMSA